MFAAHANGPYIDASVLPWVNRTHRAVSGEERLAMAIIEQAQSDLDFPLPVTYGVSLRDAALVWINETNGTFDFYCEVLRWEPAVIRRAIISRQHLHKRRRRYRHVDTMRR